MKNGHDWQRVWERLTSPQPQKWEIHCKTETDKEKRNKKRPPHPISPGRMVLVYGDTFYFLFFCETFRFHAIRLLAPPPPPRFKKRKLYPHTIKICGLWVDGGVTDYTRKQFEKPRMASLSLWLGLCTIPPPKGAQTAPFISGHLHFIWGFQQHHSIFKSKAVATAVHHHPCLGITPYSLPSTRRPGCSSNQTQRTNV